MLLTATVGWAKTWASKPWLLAQVFTKSRYIFRCSFEGVNLATSWPLQQRQTKKNTKARFFSSESKKCLFQKKRLRNFSDVLLSCSLLQRHHKTTTSCQICRHFCQTQTATEGTLYNRLTISSRGTAPPLPHYSKGKVSRNHLINLSASVCGGFCSSK